MTRYTLTRRQFGGGLAAAAVSIGAGLPVAPASAAIPPLPVHALPYFNRIVADNAKRLHRIARKVRRAEAIFETNTRAVLEWPKLYEAMVNEAGGLREKGIPGRSPADCALLEWVNSIYPDDETRARLPRERITGLSPDYESKHAEFEALLFSLARYAQALADASKERGLFSQAPYMAAMHASAKRDGTVTAWGIVPLRPRTRGDLQLHKLALEYLYSDGFVFERRYGT